MNIQDAAAIVAKIQLIDNRRVDDGVVLAWHELIGHLDFEVAMQAVTRHRQKSTEYLVPAHVLRLAREIWQEMYERQQAVGDRFLREQLADRWVYLEDYSRDVGAALEAGDAGVIGSLVEEVNGLLGEIGASERLTVAAFTSRRAIGGGS